MYSNCGFIGIPLVQSILGNEGVLYLTAYMTVFNFFSWTHGIMIMTGTFSLKELKKGLLSPMIFASILGVMFFFGRIHIPYLLLDSMNYVAGMNTPLAMLIAGISVAQTDLLSMLRNRKLYLISASKLLLMPALLLVVLALFRSTRWLAARCSSLLPARSLPQAQHLPCSFHKNSLYASELYAFTTVTRL